MKVSGRGPILVAGGQGRTAESLVVELRRLGRRAVWVDTCESAQLLIADVEFDIVVVLVDAETDWAVWEWLLGAAACPVVVATPLLARDQRYRRQAFRAGAGAYICPPYTRARLREMIRRVEEGEAGVELVERPAVHERRT